MVLQLSLGSVVGENKLSNLCRSLDTITGFPGQNLHRQTIILTPRFPYDPPAQAGQINQIQSHKMRLTRLWDNEKPPVSLLKPGESDLQEEIWTLQLSDIPAAGGDNQVSNQNIYETTIYQSDDIFGYIDELGYKTETEFWVKGQRWYWGDIIIELTQLLIQDTSNSDSVTLKPLSSNWMIRTLVNVIAINDLDSITKGKRQLVAFKKELSDIVNLSVPDRAAMDSRVGSKLGTTTATTTNLNRKNV